MSFGSGDKRINFNSNLKAAEFIGEDASTPFEDIINSDAYKEAISLLPASQGVEEVSKYYRHTSSAKKAIRKKIIVGPKLLF